MRYYVKNLGGRVTEVQDEIEVQKWLAQGFTLPTPDEITIYTKSLQEAYDEQQAKIARENKNAGEDGIFLQTVSTGAKNGYSTSAMNMLAELQDIDVPISIEYSGQKVALLYHMPYSVAHLESPIKLVMTMFDSDKIPDEWVEYLKLADRVIVPSKWCQNVFEKSGIKTDVVPLGYDEKKFTYIERKRNPGDPFTFIHYDAFNLRKGFVETFKAFCNEFKPEENVRMIFKTVRQPAPLPIPKSQYPNIDVITGPVSEDELHKILGLADCMVFPTRGEGFGLTPVESMATGLPVIVPNAHGITEYFNPAFMYEVAVEGPCSAVYGPQFKDMDCGNMVLCSVEDLQKKMRYVVDHPDEAREKGQAASYYIKNWTYKKTAEKLKLILEEALAMQPAKKPINKVLPMIEV